MVQLLSTSKMVFKIIIFFYQVLIIFSNTIRKIKFYFYSYFLYYIHHQLQYNINRIK